MHVLEKQCNHAHQEYIGSQMKLFLPQTKIKEKASLIAISSHDLAMIRITTLLNIPPLNNVKKLAILSIYIIWDIFRIFFSKYASVLLIRNVFNSGDFCFL